MAGPTNTDLQRRLEELDNRVDATVERVIGLEKSYDFHVRRINQDAAKTSTKTEQVDERINDLAERLARMEKHLESTERLYQQKIDALERRFEDKTAILEKLSDRGWSFGQAVVVSIVSMIGRALLSLLIQMGLRR